ncbi:MAG: tetratricopeptide repeat protein, partial [Nitrospiraceae bacterium]
MNSAGRIDPVLAAEIDRLATALAKDPRSKAFMPLAESYIKADMWQEAAGVLEDGLQVNPGFVTAMAALGRVYEQLGQPGKAKAILAEVVAQSPDNLRAHRILARIFSSEHQIEPALQSCEAILAVNPFDVEALSIRQAVTGQAAGDDNRPRAKQEKKRLEKYRE